MADLRDNLIGRTLDGRYRIEAVVARGGMATVYAANDLRLRRNVAVKVMHASLAEDPDFVHRFEREAHAAAQLANPHVVAVHDQGRDEATGVIYLVMEFVNGRTVRDLLAERGALTELQALAVLDPVLQALAAAHDAGFVHRDVKPENVLIGDDGRVKVTDFGLARAIIASPLSAATQGVLIGTVAYLSPEQVERGFADARSDVYGAGVLLFEMLTGQVPHSGETPLAVAYQHVHSDVPLPSTVRPGITAGTDALVNAATQRAPERRYADARAFLEAVRNTRAGIDTGYTPPPTPERHTLILEHGAQSVSTDTVVVTPAAPSSRKRRWPLLLAALLVVPATSGYWLWTNVLTKSEVPAVVGVSQTVAQQRLSDASLRVQVITEWNAEIAEGNVVSSQPVAATTVDRDTVVQLVVSKGRERYEVPPLTGIAVAEAKLLLGTVKLIVGDVTKVYDETVKTGVILASDPGEGTVLEPGDRVDLRVSKGPAPIPVPPVAGRTQADALVSLDAAGFATATTLVYSDSVPAGSVVSTAPGAGALLQRGSRVTVSVSKGPAPVTVPNVVGKKAADATAILQRLGLKVVVKKLGTPKFGVQSQSPAAGSVVAKGTTVTITIV